MAAAPWPQGVDRVILPEVDSTSAELRRRAPAVPTWLMADRQTAGRGRRGRSWAMPAGNFAASLAWRPGGDPAQMALRSFVASLALHDALTEVGVADLSLKWPNDVLLGGEKLAGILLETAPGGLLILGIGVNLAAAPDTGLLEAGALPPTALKTSGHDIATTAFLDILAPAFAAREGQMATFGFAPIRTAWLARAGGLGDAITARLPGEVIAGTFDDVDHDGHLLLRTATGQRRITAGDVFFGGVPCS